MVTLSRFIQDGKKSKDMHLCSIDVPPFWKGFYAIYKPNTKFNTSSFWLKRWHANKKGRVIETADMIVETGKAHSFWNKNIMNDIKATL